MIRSIAKKVALAVVPLSLVSCAGFYAPLETLIHHDCECVAVPATVGAVAAGAVGVPIAILAMPVTVTISSASPSGPNLLPIAPVFAVAQVGAIVVGGLPWLLMAPFSSAPAGAEHGAK